MDFTSESKTKITVYHEAKFMQLAFLLSSGHDGWFCSVSVCWPHGDFSPVSSGEIKG